MSYMERDSVLHRVFLMPKVKDVPYLKVAAKTGLHKYVRRVPENLQTAVGKRVWEKRLGSDYNKALRKCLALTDEHDSLIASLSEPGAVEAKVERNQTERKALVADLLLEVAKNPMSAPAMPEVVTKEHWRDTETKMKKAALEGEHGEREVLAIFLAYAFGDRSYMDAQPTDDPMGDVLVKHTRPTRPTDPMAAMMFDAMKGMVVMRLRQLQKVVPTNSEDTLLKLLDRYAGLQSLTDNTRRAYEHGIKRLNDHEGELSARDITSRMLKDHRDRLVAAGLEPTSIRTLFAGIGSVLAFAYDEEIIETNPALGMKFPRDTKSVEDRKHLPFRPDDVRKIWEAAQDRFDPSGKSRLSKDRRRAYLMCIKTLFLTGMRPHEFFRLHDHDVCDVSKIDAYQDEWEGIGIDIRFSKSGDRLIPLPDALADLPAFINGGGLECIRDVRDIVNKFSDKQFDVILTDLGLKRPRVSLYSTRATFNMAMKRNGVSLEVRQQIIGHKPHGQMMRHYTDPETMDVMADAMNGVAFW